jgi:hypothetical protein
MRAVRALEGVPESKLEKIGTRNALVLVRLPDRERKRDEWIEKAGDVECKLYGESRLTDKSQAPRCKRLVRVGGVCTG